MAGLRKKDTSLPLAKECVPKDMPVTTETAKEKTGIWQKVKKWWHGS